MNHAPFGKKEQRKAIQLGLKGGMLERFGKHYICRIEDVTNFVIAQRQLLDKRKVGELQIPIETIMDIKSTELRTTLGM